jgi:hypothetical protein
VSARTDGYTLNGRFLAVALSLALGACATVPVRPVTQVYGPPQSVVDGGSHRRVWATVKAHIAAHHKAYWLSVLVGVPLAIVIAQWPKHQGNSGSSAPPSCGPLGTLAAPGQNCTPY